MEDIHCNQAIQFCHDASFDILDFYYHGFNVIGFFTFNDFQACATFCSDQNFSYINYQIACLHL